VFDKHRRVNRQHDYQEYDLDQKRPGEEHQPKPIPTAKTASTVAAITDIGITRPL